MHGLKGLTCGERERGSETSLGQETERLGSDDAELLEFLEGSFGYVV